MSIDISTDIIHKLEHNIAEIRTRAINNVQSKFQSCNTDLHDLTVNVYELIKRLFKWFEFKPVTHVKQIFEILLILLKSKYRNETVRILERYIKRGELQKLNIYAADKVTKGYHQEIIHIVSNNRAEILKQPEKTEPVKIEDPLESWRSKDLNENSNSVDVNGLRFEEAWEVVEEKELQVLCTLKGTFSPRHSQKEIDHALNFFHQYINDFPGEFFLQNPFLFVTLLQLIESEADIELTSALTCCLKLTQNLCRRVTYRKVACMSIAMKKPVTKKQVTIGSYCYKTFQAILGLLRTIYNESKLAYINECLQILIEIVVLICKSAEVYSVAVGNEYHIDEIIAQLADFLRYIREMTQNYRLNSYKTNRNNSISILYLLCELVMFKGRKDDEDEQTVVADQSLNETSFDISHRFLLGNMRKQLEDLNFLESTCDADDVSSSTIGNYVTAVEQLENDIWRRELEIALLDFPLRHFYPQVYDLIDYAFQVDSLPENNYLKVLCGVSEKLHPVVHLLRSPSLHSHETILANGLKAISVLTLVKSDELTYLLFNAITNLVPEYNNNEELQKDAERLLLHLMSSRCIETKRLIYRLTSEKMSQFYSRVMEGRKVMLKSYMSTVNQSCLFGLPISSEILAEIVCNGLSSPDDNTATCAENIILLVLRIKSLVPRYWDDVCGFLIPVLPLILCHARSTTQLGQMILSLVEPGDENTMPTIVLIKSSVALLFSRDTHSQREAICRLLFILQSIPNAEMYMPNIKRISDTIPDNMCVVEPLAYQNNEDFTDLYETYLVDNLLDVLQCRNTEPSIRHSTLTQLNIVLEDPAAMHHFFDREGHSLILDTLDKSLREESIDNYPYNAIQLVGILMKMSIRFPAVRRLLENDIQTYVLLVRSLLLFPTDDQFKRECSVLLFILAYGNYIIGANRRFIVPNVCKRLYLPIVCEFGWKVSTQQEDLLEFLSSNESNGQKVSSNLSTISIDSISTESPKTQQIWRYIRMNFSALWFGTLDYLIDCPNYSKDNKQMPIDYKTHTDSMSFNKALCVTLSDLEIIEGTSQKCGLSYWVKYLKNATKSLHVTSSCAAIENFSNLDAMGHRKHWDCQAFLLSINRFCTVIPSTKLDIVVFTKVCHLISNLIERDFIDVHTWMLNALNQKNCIYLDLLVNTKISTELFKCNVQILESVLTKTIQVESKNIIHQHVYNPAVGERDAPKGKSCKNKTKQFNLYERIFETCIAQVDVLLKERKAEDLRALVPLIHVLSWSQKVVDNDYHASFACNTLLKIVLSVPTMSYVGASFTKKCLQAIGNLMICVDEVRIETKYIQFLQILCGHVDFEIRACSWSILLKISSTITGAQELVRLMDTLPSGLYACCLNTLLDDTESALVRENAALVFATLISYRKPNNELDEKLYPHSAARMGNNWIDLMLRHHNFIGIVQASINRLHVDETINVNSIAANKTVSCNLMRSYCVILTNLLPLKDAGDQNAVFPVMIEIIRLIPQIRQSINKSSILLLTEICAFISQCISSKSTLIDLIAREYHIVQSLLSFLSVDLFESISQVIKHSCWPQILKLLQRLALSPLGFQAICETISQRRESLEDVVTFFIYGLCDKDINVPVMRFITGMMILSQADEYQFPTFAEQLDEMSLSQRNKESSKLFVFNTSIPSQSIVNCLEADLESKADLCATEIFYMQQVELFEKSSESFFKPSTAKDKSFEFNCKLLETLLKCSEKVRAIATEDKLVIKVVDQMENIFSSVDDNFTDYIRKSGNKAEFLLGRLKRLFNILLCWFSDDCLHDTDCIQPLISFCQRLWRSIGVDAELQQILMKMLLFISNDSLPVCKALSTTPQVSASSTFLNWIIEYCKSETGKPKSAQANLDTLQTALQIVTNCCCCLEGRMLINKAQMLQTLSRLHPQVTRNQKPWPQLTYTWLSLYEVLTRSQDASKEAHLNLLCNLAESASAKIRHRSLEIIRNMSFNQENRAALLSSDDFLRIVYSILDKNELGDEQLLITVSIWKLIANHAKSKSIIKNSPIFKKLRLLKENLERHTSSTKLKGKSINMAHSINETIEDLEVVLKCVLDILQT